MNKTQTKILNDAAKNGYATCDGVREVTEAKKLEALGLGKFENMGFWERNNKGRVKYISGGHFIPLS